MAPRYLKVIADGDTTTYGSMPEAVIAFGKALRLCSNVRLVEERLDGEQIIAQNIEHAHSIIAGQEDECCVVCGRPWCHGHDHDTTAQRILMQHESGNHSQCHPGAACDREESHSESG